MDLQNEPEEENKNPDGLRVIKTGRDIASINNAAKNGYLPLVKKVIPSPEIRSKYLVVQNKTTGEIFVAGDSRFSPKAAKFKRVIDWTFYYPYNFGLPFAAYLVPKDIQVGERVFLEDVIEDIVGSSWNQGDTYRLESSEAIWNGDDFEIQFIRRPDWFGDEFVG